MMGLLKHERTLATYWELSTPQDHITIIALEAVPISTKSCSSLRTATQKLESWFGTHA